MPQRSTTRREALRQAAQCLAAVPAVNLFAQDDSFDGFVPHGQPLPLSRNNPAVQHLPENCIECGRCRLFCYEAIGVFGHPAPEDEECCIHCGQCTLFCQANALSERIHYPLVIRALNDPKKTVVASLSPAVRVSLGELFAMEPGTNVEGKIAAALKKAGFDYVLDTAFAADVTVMEEAAELIQTLNQNDKPVPMFTSCCPAWVRYAQLFYPKLLPNISTVKSPIAIQGAILKTYFAEKHQLDPAKIVHVALTPCTAKKAEILLPEMNTAAIELAKPVLRDTDIVLTTRELAALLAEKNVDLKTQVDEPFDSLMGTGSGAGVLFGNTGGVTEAVLRTAYKLLNQKEPPKDFYELKPVRGLRRIRLAEVDLGVRKLRVAQLHGIGDAPAFLDAVENGDVDVSFVEVMACPGGCIGGGGQPKEIDADPSELKLARMNGLYKQDGERRIRLSCENPEVKAVYDEFLGKSLGERAEKLLHRRK